MIPLRLTVRNFMCYRNNVPTLDLESIHVACLCGDNGHGKTALLDAMTWVLWGQARARTQEELVHQGEQNMSVELDFLAREQVYRVSRRYAKSGRSRQGSTLLELQVESEGGFTPITGNTVRDTEARIRDILHLDYDTFTNTAFLLQGRADMFTSSTPSQRKACLAEVLDLSYYAKLEEEAKSRSRELQDGIRDIDSIITMRQQEIARRPEYEAELEAVNATLAQIAPELDSHQKQAEQLRRSVGLLDDQRRELENLNARLEGSRSEITQLERQVNNYQTRIDQYEAVKQKEPEIRHQFAILKAARSGLEKLNEALEEQNEFGQEKASLEQAIAIQAERLSNLKKQMETRISEDLEPKAARIQQIQQEIETVRIDESSLVEIEQDISFRRKNIADLTQKLDQMEKDQERVNQLEREKASQESQIALQKSTLDNQLQQLRLKITNDLKPKADRIPEITELFDQASQEDEKLSAEAEVIRQDRESAEELDSRVRFIRQDNENLREAMNDTRKKFDMLEQGEATCPLCGEPLDEEGKQRLRSEYEAQGLEQKNRFNANLAELETVSAEHKHMATAIPKREAELEKKRETIRGTMLGLKRDAEDSRNAFAELKNVSIQFEELVATITNDEYALEERQRITEIEQELKDIGFSVEARRSMQELVRKLNGEITELDADLNTKRQNTQGKVALLERELLDSTKARDELEPAMAELEGVTTQLRGNNFAREERQKLAELNVKLAAIGYDAAKHRQTRDQVRSLERYDDMYRKLMEAVERLPPAYEEMESASQMLKRRQAEIKDGVARMAKLEEELKTLPSLEAQLKEEETALAALEAQRSKSLIEQGRINQQIARCDTLKSEISADEKRRHALVEEKGIYDELAVAFGKNGIQTLIIESAIPQIEDDANELLGRLTDNRMFLRFDLKEGRRDARTKQPTEELNIRIADEIGTRSYETFSGGEAFRINFAIRIALSKLLARRSGAPLPILFIDEGFGSQDSTGQERLTEAIQSIQDDFQKIIVITHIDAIKEAFPVRIEVQKTETGSEFVIV